MEDSTSTTMEDYLEVVKEVALDDEDLQTLLGDHEGLEEEMFGAMREGLENVEYDEELLEISMGALERYQEMYNNIEEVTEEEMTPLGMAGIDEGHPRADDYIHFVTRSNEEVYPRVVSVVEDRLPGIFPMFEKAWEDYSETTEFEDALQEQW